MLKTSGRFFGIFTRSKSDQAIDSYLSQQSHCITWEYKVVQMFSQTPADATDASKKLGGALSPEGLRNQFPEHYGTTDGRKQINDFLNKLGEEGWELIEIQQVMNLPLMILKRRKYIHNSSPSSEF